MNYDFTQDLTELKAIDWFSNVGQPISKPMEFKVQRVTTVASFEENILSVDWENIQLEANNTLTSYLKNKRVKNENQYNAVVERIKEDLGFLEEVNQKFTNQFEISILDDLNWNILSFLIERFYFHQSKHIPLFYQQLVTIYKEGNVPCSFLYNVEGDLSKGGIILYF